MKIPFFSFESMQAEIREEINTAFQKVYNSGWYILGDELSLFEKQFAGYTGTRYCAGVGNGLEALRLSLLALGTGPGDEVIVPSNTYIATVLAVSQTGATPVFAEPRPETFNLNPETLERYITKKTRVIIPVHLFGQACEMTAIDSIARHYGLKLVEDNAQAQGATWLGVKTGSFGHINATSFYPGKNLGALGDGGGITTDDEELYQKIIRLRNYGSVEKYHHELQGFNSRLDEMQAAFLQVKLEFLDKWNNARRTIGATYTKELEGIEGLRLPETAVGAMHVFHQYVIRTRERNRLQAHLEELGVGTLIHYPVPPFMQPAYAHLQVDEPVFPVAMEMAACSLSLPIYPGLSEDDQQYIIDSIKSFFR